ncbi:uncharacterized protein LOC129884221 [Solanum dulcamara]|uniref:uncharacterized protein LOC129884221 n=1 Tax=Solanum dulcamara TaxID=45834 RepID=UPI002485E893|nr:uncharacterized protein LOC129884221 [Solanum dulcamara]
MRFCMWGKLSPRYIRPFDILRRIREVAYELALPPISLTIHPGFHVSILCRYIPDVSYVLQYDSLELDDRLTFVEEPISILARDVHQLHSMSIPVVKDRAPATDVNRSSMLQSALETRVLGPKYSLPLDE